MTLLRRAASIIRWIARRSRSEQALDDELQGYLEMAVAEKVRDGVPAQEARRLALLELGGLEQVKEQVRTGRHGGWLDDVGRDVRYAFRTFARNRGFTATVVLTLALGIGANTAIFSLIDALMLRWLPVPNPSALVRLEMRAPGSAGPAGGSFSYAIAQAFADRPEVFSAAAGFSNFSFDVGPPESSTRVDSAIVTGDYYATLRLTPVQGRLLSRADDRPGAPLVAVISHGYWERQLARDPLAVGRIIRVNDQPVTIVGISPRGFAGANVGSRADLTMTVAALPHLSPSAAPLLGSGNFWLRIIARPAPGLTVEEAAVRANAAWRDVADSVIAPHWSSSRRQQMAESVFELTAGGTGWTYLRALYQKPLFVLMGVASLVLLIACANVASLLLARASIRQREIGLRLAIGASRGRIVRQLVIESVALSMIGSACGVALAWISSRFLVDLISTGPAQVVFDLTPNWRVLGFASAISLATGVLFGLGPALRSTAAGSSSMLKEDARMSGSRSRLLPSLVVVQVALSLVLLAGAGLFVRTLQNLRNLDPGFAFDSVFVVDLDGRRVPAPRGLLDEVRLLPGVTSASLTTHTPLSGATWSEPAVPAGQPLPERDNAHFIGAGQDFFATLQMRVLVGRGFGANDGPRAPRVAVVNEIFAKQHFPDQNPVGRHLSARVRNDTLDLEIIGVVNNIHAGGLRSGPPPIVYVAYDQLVGDGPANLVVRASGSEESRAAIRQALHRQAPGVRLDLRSLAKQVNATIVQERIMATLAGAFGFLALALTCVGLYGLLSYGVAQRTKEIGIRMALGARPSGVIGLVLGGGGRLVAIGVALGLPAAWGASRWIESMLFGVTPTDPVTVAAAVLLLVLAAQMAAYLPARRASHVDPLIALRHE